ncbi:MAG: class I SAM-dependent methyltransferase [Acidobacteriia bacterium]|nr:class I SAM-dependent methyltransferase [Terriglobia bacterium]
MTQRINVYRVKKWRSRLGPRLCPYDNRLFLGRWFFYQRFQRALNCCPDSPQSRVMDFGCWEGHFLPSLLANYHQVWGVDNDRASVVEEIPGTWTILQCARSLCSEESPSTSHLRLVKADGQSLPVRGGFFDIVFCLDTLPYVRKNSRAQVIIELRRVLKPGGTIIISLPVEMGASLVLRELLRRLSGSFQQNYKTSDLLRAILFSPRQQPDENEAASLVGYDYREDIDAIESQFIIRRREFLPWNWLKWLSPTILLVCETRPDRA